MVAMPLAGRNTESSQHDSTYNILKSLSPGRNMRDLPSAADAIMICTDAILQQTANRSARQSEMTDDLINRVGDMCNSVQNVQEQTKDAETPPVTNAVINEVNKIIDRTNGDSNNQFAVNQHISKLVTDNNISQDKILSAHSKGDVTSDQLIQKLREQQEKVKASSSNVDKDLARLARERHQSESIVNNMQKDVHGMMSRYSVKPVAANTMQAGNQGSSFRSIDSDARSSTAPAETSGRRSPGSSK